MKNSVNEKSYTITVIGGGLTGHLMVSLLLKSNSIDPINFVGLIK